MKWRTWAAILSATTFIAFAGALTGTLAWYAYATRASVSLDGTSVYSTEQLQMGLKTSKSISLVDDFSSRYEETGSSGQTRFYSLKKDDDASYSEVVETNDSLYWFTQPGSGLTSADIGNYINRVSSYSAYTNTLIPVTTRAYEKGDGLNLYRSPARGEDFRGVAEEYSYSKISFAFRVVTTSKEYVKNQGIWLVDAKESVSSSAGDSLRLFFEGERRIKQDDESYISEESKVLFNPNAKNDGTTTVAGLLDLDNDGYYDFDQIDYSTATGREYIYGLGYENQPENTQSVFENDVFGKESDINHYYGEDVAEDKKEKNTFFAAHKEGNRGYESLDSYDLPKQHYQGQESVYPQDKSGVLTQGTVLTSTSGDDLAIASLDMTLFMEGWDHSVIDKNIDYQFQLGLTFQVNKVNKQYEA